MKAGAQTSDLLYPATVAGPRHTAEPGVWAGSGAVRRNLLQRQREKWVKSNCSATTSPTFPTGQQSPRIGERSDEEK
jgi:hypothetical protein